MKTLKDLIAVYGEEQVRRFALTGMRLFEKRMIKETLRKQKISAMRNVTSGHLDELRKRVKGNK